MTTAIAVQNHSEALLHTLKDDMIVGIHNDEYLYLSQVFHFIFHDRITIEPANKKPKHPNKTSLKRGWVHVNFNKSTFGSEKSGVWVRSISTLLKLANSNYEYMTYGTFHLNKTKLQRSVKERRRENLNSVHAIVLDIDTKDLLVDDILKRVERANLPLPSFVNETIRGYHLWFVFEPSGEPCGPHKDENGIGSFYNDMNEALVRLYQEVLPVKVDHLIGGERYIRIPKKIVHWGGTKYSLKDIAKLKSERIKQPKNSQKKHSFLVYQINSNKAFNQLVSDPAIKELYYSTPGIGNRRYTALTLALFFKDNHFSKEMTITALTNWYRTVLNSPSDFPWKEVEREIKWVYANESHCSPKWVYRLIGMYPQIITKKKSKEERINQTLEDSCNAFMEMLRQNNGRLETTTRDAMHFIGINSKNNFERVVSSLLNKKVIRKVVIGRGRKAKTIYYVIPNSTPGKRFKIYQTINAPKPFSIIKSVLGGMGGDLFSYSKVLDSDSGGHSP